MGLEAEGEFTGKYLVVMHEDGVHDGLKLLKQSAGLSQVCRANDFGGSAVEMESAAAADVLVLDELNVAVIDADPDQFAGLQTGVAAEGPIQFLEPERYMYALTDPALSLEYLRGYRDSIDDLYRRLSGAATRGEAEFQVAAFGDTARATWGLLSTKVDQSRYQGRNTKVAVLDTGLDLNHPDFVGRSVTSQSFVTGETVQDRVGHGTHCAGTVGGRRAPTSAGRRYGCASACQLFVGKVLGGPNGRGSDSGILAGINWAIVNGCQIISMSLGAPVLPGDTFSPTYEAVAKRALHATPGTLIVVAAGNDSRNPATGQRLNPPRPVSRPANCPSILAVGAIDPDLRVAPFSNGGVNGEGGGVDIVGPGVGVYSSYPIPSPPGGPAAAGYHVLSGTSMATPHVAGIAALWREYNPQLTALSLWQTLTSRAMRLNLPSRDVGSGLVQAPVS
ncbi:MAG: S8 family serine peptidase [Planctomycetaceae bacterium]